MNVEPSIQRLARTLRLQMPEKAALYCAVISHANDVHGLELTALANRSRDLVVMLSSQEGDKAFAYLGQVENRRHKQTVDDVQRDAELMRDFGLA